jgi:glycosyltransferase involved in cell wall biosynthesis
MRIAFYAPLKPPDHPVASGDRAMGRALIEALELAGHDVQVAARFRSLDAGDAARQARIRDIGLRLADRLARRFEKSTRPPHLWFTYHLYHKAPDWLGPRVADCLGIPYVVAEASYAPKQAGGRWDLGHHGVADAIRRADRIFQLNPADAECVLPLLKEPERLVRFAPFLRTAPFREPNRAASRAIIATEHGLAEGEPWLLTVAMMRNDQKLLSYRCLAAALDGLTDLPWRLIIAGAGPAEADVRAAFAPLADRVTWIGVLGGDALRRLYRAADLYVWPAVKEAFGMTLLEAQAAGLPVVAGRSGGVPAIVAEEETGLLAPEGDAASFAAAARLMLSEPQRRARMGEAAMRRTASAHDIAGAARLLDRELRALVGASAS